MTWLFEQLAQINTHTHTGTRAVHRDVKSPNVLLTSDDTGKARAKLCDFGSTKIVGHGKRRYNQVSPQASTAKWHARKSLWHAHMTGAQGTVRSVGAFRSRILQSFYIFVSNTGTMDGTRTFQS